MDLNLDKKVAVVTGSASKKGIGRAIALTLAQEGADVALADVDLEGIQEVAQEIKKIGRKALSLRVDQGIYDEVKEAVIQINKEMGSIDILVNNAANTHASPASSKKMTPSSWNEQVGINLNGIFYWCHEVLPVMGQKGWGRIINISSVAAIFGARGLSAYAASKAGLVAFTKTLALESARNGITVNAVSPGMIDTEVYIKGGLDPVSVEALKKRMPMGRMGDPSEIGHLVAFLASDKAAYINGANMVIDGGATLGIE